jgi:beta-mannosidase
MIEKNAEGGCMKAIELNGAWRMREVGKPAWHDAVVPGGVAKTLIAHGIMDDPYFRDNEGNVQTFFDADYEFERTFITDNALLALDRVLLRCEGLDTLAVVSLNGIEVGRADNMHRTWEFDVKAALREGENQISVRFSSPVKYVEAHKFKGGRPFATIRKAACMFGWDWGLTLPDMGIWRDISIDAFDGGRIGRVEVRQKHENGVVSLNLRVLADKWEDGVETQVEIADPNGEVVFRSRGAREDVIAVIEHPRLWQPAGYGEQPLYRVTARLLQGETVLDEWLREIGLREIRLNRDPLQDGRNFGFEVNGRRVYFKGANLIIPDAVLGETDDAKWERLVDDCVRANMNGVRVWGGAYYPPDSFFAACDRAGLLVWQDFMFACSFYPTDKVFLANVRAELRDNLARIAHHPSVALLCGNNEVDFIYTVFSSRDAESDKLRRFFGVNKRAGFLTLLYVRRLYEKLFLKAIPPVCAECAPEIDYVHSSPTAGEKLGAPSYMNYLSSGDMHYYIQYDGNAPYKKMRAFKCRFMSEMGFQSYPSMKTIRAFTGEADRGPDTKVMLSHQKCKNGNETIELYMARDYRVPKDFADYVYLSQLQAGEILKYSVEEIRRTIGYNNGVILWQLNDCWPVVSWAGVDGFGRWKAQQYYTKRFFAPVLATTREDGTRVELWVTNDGPADFAGTLRWKLCDNAGNAARSGEMEARAAAGEAEMLAALEFAEQLADGGASRLHLEYDCGEAGRGCVLFVPAKDFAFEKPALTAAVTQSADGYEIVVSTDRFARGVALELGEDDCLFSDNFFDLFPGEARRIAVDRVKTADLEKQLRITCLNDVLLRAER